VEKAMLGIAKGKMKVPTLVIGKKKRSRGKGLTHESTSSKGIIWFIILHSAGEEEGTKEAHR